MNNILKYVGYFLFISGLLTIFIWLIVRSTSSDKCKGDSECASGDKCIGGTCTTPSSDKCKGDSDCASGDKCIGGTCTTPSSDKCKGDSECASGDKCIGGTCTTPSSDKCKGDSDCASGDKCIGGTCTTPSSDKCKDDSDCANGDKCIGGTCTTPSSDNFLSIELQPKRSIQLANNTSDGFLHIFIQCTSVRQTWTKIGGTGKIATPVDWGTLRDKNNKNSGNYAWDPPGAVILAEVIIPKDKYIIINLPSDVSTFIIQPIKMKKSNNNTPLKLKDNINKIIKKQSSLLFEATVNKLQSGVADISGVNGVNYRVKYSMTTSKGVEHMEIKKNPCARINKKYKLEVGCWSPVKIICGSSPTCDCKVYTRPCGEDSSQNCKESSQNCKFNKCSQELFKIPSNMKQYIGNYDRAGGPTPPYNDYSKFPEYVKKFINNNKNLEQESDQANYCDDIQANSGDYTTYCYDYNDLGASPVWKNPYKAKLVYFDL
jgi:hypothetical protein